MSAQEGAGWVAVVGWDDLTHRDSARGDGPLPWVRSHTRLLQDDAYLELPPGTRAVYHGILLAYASGRCRCRADTRSLTRRLGMRVTSSQLEALSHAGFIRICASIVLAERWHESSPRDARDRDRDREEPRAVLETRSAPQARAERPQDLEQDQGNGRLDAVLPKREEPDQAVERMRRRIGRAIP